MQNKFYWLITNEGWYSSNNIKLHTFLTAPLDAATPHSSRQSRVSRGRFLHDDSFPPPRPKKLVKVRGDDGNFGVGVDREERSQGGGVTSLNTINPPKLILGLICFNFFPISPPPPASARYSKQNLASLVSFTMIVKTTLPRKENISVLSVQPNGGLLLSTLMS